MRLIKDVNEIKAALRHVTTNLPLFDIANENSPASLSTSQNNYVPGNYDVLRINATANINITGFANGKKGRFLEIINVGTGRISFPDESTSSIAINRISTPYDQTITILPNARARFYYDSTTERWTVSDLPNIQGQFGRYAIISHNAQTVQTISAFTETQIQPNTVISDEWGYWDATNFEFVIPSGESGLYSIYVCFFWNTGDTTDYLHTLKIYKNITANVVGYDNYYRVGTTSSNWGVSYQGLVTMSAGDTLGIRVQTNPASGTPTRDIRIFSANIPIFVFSKVG